MKLAAYRKSKGWTQGQLATELGLKSKGYVSAIETGRERCPLKLALRIDKWSGGAVAAASLCPEAADLLPTPPATPPPMPAAT